MSTQDDPDAADLSPQITVDLFRHHDVDRDNARSEGASAIRIHNVDGPYREWLERRIAARDSAIEALMDENAYLSAYNSRLLSIAVILSVFASCAIIGSLLGLYLGWLSTLHK